MGTDRGLSVIHSLDGLRGIAALMVMEFHFFQTYPIEGTGIWKWLLQLTVFGQTGVDLFFVLSGFLITRILLATRDRPDYFISFYFRRALRIFPLYYFALIVYYFIFLPFMQEPTPVLKHQWWYWCYLQNIPDTFTTLRAVGPGHFWSLAVEEHFYLVWPFVIFLVPRQRVALFCYLALILAFLSRWFLLSQEIGVFYFTPCRIDALAIGALLATWERDGSLFHRTRFFLFCGIVLALALTSMMIAYGSQGRSEVQLFKFLAFALFYGCVLGILRNKGEAPIPFLSTHVLRWTGKISYGLYVYHPFVYTSVRHWLDNCLIPKPILFIVCFASTYLVAWISYRFLESPFLLLKNKFTTPTVQDAIKSATSRSNTVVSN